MVKMVNFILRVFYRNKKKKERKNWEQSLKGSGHFKAGRDMATPAFYTTASGEVVHGLAVEQTQAWWHQLEGLWWSRPELMRVWQAQRETGKICDRTWECRCGSLFLRCVTRDTVPVGNSGHFQVWHFVNIAWRDYLIHEDSLSGIHMNGFWLLLCRPLGQGPLQFPLTLFLFFSFFLFSFIFFPLLFFF